MSRRRKHRPRKLRGRDFEEMFLGKAGEEANFISYKPLRTSVFESVRNTLVVTGFSSKLKELVEKYLKSLGVVSQKLLVSETLGTHADTHYGADLVFFLEGENAPFVTVDLFHISDKAAINIISARYPERFGMGNDVGTRRWAARIVLITNYLQFQNDLFTIKARIRGKEMRNRRSNHFVLTPFDLYRGRGLRALGREIALSLKDQIRK